MIPSAFLMVAAGIGGFHEGRIYQQRQLNEISDHATMSCAMELDVQRDRFDAQRKTVGLWADFATKVVVERDNAEDEVDRLKAQRRWVEPYMKAGTLIVVGR
jgi:hypothetical protein